MVYVSLPWLISSKQYDIAELRIGQKCTQSAFMNQQELSPAHHWIEPPLIVGFGLCQALSHAISCQPPKLELLIMIITILQMSNFGAERLHDMLKLIQTVSD